MGRKNAGKMQRTGKMPQREFLKEGETLDDLLCGGLKIIQGRNTYRFGSDSVRLADFAAPRRMDRVLDLGCGDGVLMFLMWAKDHTLRFVGAEIRPEACSRAERSVCLNGLEDRVTVLRCDIRALWESVDRAGFDLCVCNPPYWGTDRFEDDGARTQMYFTWEDLFRAAAYALRSRGRLCVIIPAEKTDEVLACGFDMGFSLKRLQAVHADRNACAKRILLELCCQGRHGGVRVMPPVILNGEGLKA